MDIEITKSIYDKMVGQKFMVSIMGLFDQDLLMSLISITDKKLSGLDVQDSIKRKIFHFMVECSQNILRVDRMGEHRHNNMFLIAQEGDEFTVHLGSALPKENLTPVLATIAKVNEIQAVDIKKKYYEELVSSDFVHQNFLLLGLLSIAKKTKKNIEYDLIDLAGGMSFLTFKMTISK